MIQNILIFLGIVIFVEFYRYRKRRIRENEASYMNLEGTFIHQEIINRSYFTGTGLGRPSTTVKNLFMLIYSIKDSDDKVFKVAVAQSQFYNAIAYTESLNSGDKVRLKIKKYPDDDVYFFVENL
jgi:hypothetical protein